MSWFGGGLSSLQGKITSFTREVISDVVDSVQGTNLFIVGFSYFRATWLTRQQENTVIHVGDWNIDLVFLLSNAFLIEIHQVMEAWRKTVKPSGRSQRWRGSRSLKSVWFRKPNRYKMV